MNNRIKKKFRKRNWRRHYIDYIGEKLMMSVLSKADAEAGDIPYFVFSKNGKHLVHAYLLKNVSLSGASVTEVEPEKEFTLDFMGCMHDFMDTEEQSDLSPVAEKMKEFNDRLINSMKNIMEEELMATEGTNKPYSDMMVGMIGSAGKACSVMEEIMKDSTYDQKHPLLAIDVVTIEEGRSKNPMNYYLTMPGDICLMKETVGIINHSKLKIISLFPGIPADIEGIWKAKFMETRGIINIKNDVAEVDVCRFLRTLKTYAEDPECEMVILPFSPGYRLILNSLNILYFYIRPNKADRATFEQVVRKACENAGAPIEAGSFADGALNQVMLNWDSYFREDQDCLENARISIDGTGYVNKTLIYYPFIDGTGMFQMEDTINEAFGCLEK